MQVSKFYLTISTRPLHEAAEKRLPVIETTVELKEISGVELMQLMREARKHLGGQHENH